MSHNLTHKSSAPTWDTPCSRNQHCASSTTNAPQKSQIAETYHADEDKAKAHLDFAHDLHFSMNAHNAAPKQKDHMQSRYAQSNIVNLLYPNFCSTYAILHYCIHWFLALIAGLYRLALDPTGLLVNGIWDLLQVDLGAVNLDRSMHTIDIGSVPLLYGLQAKLSQALQDQCSAFIVIG